MTISPLEPEDAEQRPKALSEEGAVTMLRQAFDLWVNPEIEKRRAAGTLPDPFELYMAQRIQFPDGRNLVRLNDEVRGIANVRAQREVKAGEPVSLADMAGIEDFDIPDDELDAGHWTMIWTGKSWFVSFNFLSNRAKCKMLLQKASEFFEAAKSAIAMGYTAVGVDTMFSACELISKAALVSSHVIAIDVRTHGQIASKINEWRRLGNVEGAFVDLFNRLGRLRPRFRYDASFSDLEPITSEDCELVQSMIELGRNRLSRSVRHLPSQKIPGEL